MSIPSERFHEIIKKYVQYTLMNDLFRIYFFKRLHTLLASKIFLDKGRTARRASYQGKKMTMIKIGIVTTMKIITTTIITVQ